MNRGTFLVAITATLVFTVSRSEPPTTVDEIALKVQEAYGGRAFAKLEALRLVDKHKRFLDGQSYHPGNVDMETVHVEVFIDLAGKRKEMRLLGVDEGVDYVQHTLFDGSSGFRIQHDHKTIARNENSRFSNVDRQFSLGFDSVLARLLIDHESRIEFDGDVDYRGEPHHALRFEPSGFPRMRILIDASTGLISKMSRPHWQPGNEFAYHFGHHAVEEPVPFARELYVTQGGMPSSVSVARLLETDPDLSEAFVKPRGYADAPKLLRFENMIVRKLSDTAYLVGQNWGFSLFIVSGEHVAAVGGYEGLTERLAAFRSESEIELPLSYQIVTHHHEDHLGGMNEAAAIGARFVVVAENVEILRQYAGADLAADRLIVVDSEATFEGGAFSVLNFPNGHAASNLVVYVPAAKTVFTADLFTTRNESGPPNGYAGLVDFRNALMAAGFDVEKFASAHSGRVLSMNDLDKAIANRSETTVCPSGWSLCKH